MLVLGIMARRNRVARRRRVNRRRGMLRKRYRPGAAGMTTARLGSVHWFKEMALSPTPIVSASTTSNQGVMTFQLSDLTNIGSFKALFDLYKITGVRLKLVPQFNVSQFPVGGTTPAGPELLPMLYIAENRDPFVPPPASVSDILNDDGCKVIRVSRPINLYLKNPKALLQGTSSDGTVTIQEPWQLNSNSKALQPWLPTGGNAQTKDASNWPHYGFRWYLDNTQSTVGVRLNTYVTYYFSMKEQD